jgi:hypothetical protein
MNFPSLGSPGTRLSETTRKAQEQRLPLLGYRRTATSCLLRQATPAITTSQRLSTEACLLVQDSPAKASQGVVLQLVVHTHLNSEGRSARGENEGAVHCGVRRAPGLDRVRGVTPAAPARTTAHAYILSWELAELSNSCPWANDSPRTHIYIIRTLTRQYWPT